MPSIITFRRASPGDRTFLAETIHEAEKSGSPRSANQVLFDLSDAEYRDILMRMLEEDVPGCEYSPGSFFLALADGEPVGAMAIWVEGAGNQSSNMIKSNLLSYAVGREKWLAARAGLLLLGSVSNPRKPGTFQIDAGYVRDGFRGLMVSTGMNLFSLQAMMHDHPEVDAVQVSCIIENQRSLHALRKTGFREVARKESDHPGLKELIPGTGFVQLEMPLSQLNFSPHDV